MESSISPNTNGDGSKILRIPVDSEFEFWLYKYHLPFWEDLRDLAKEYDSEKDNSK
jgi:hypothetical protein